MQTTSSVGVHTSQIRSFTVGYGEADTGCIRYAEGERVSL